MHALMAELRHGVRYGARDVNERAGSSNKYVEPEHGDLMLNLECVR